MASKLVAKSIGLKFLVVTSIVLFISTFASSALIALNEQLTADR